MPLRVELKPFERIVIGETVLVNSGTRTSFLIDGDAPILAREGYRHARDRRYAGQAALPLRSDDVSEERYREIPHLVSGSPERPADIDPSAASRSTSSTIMFPAERSTRRSRKSGN